MAKKSFRTNEPLNYGKYRKRLSTIPAHIQRLRSAGEFKLEVNTGVDWFELNGTVDFDGVSVSLPALTRCIQWWLMCAAVLPLPGRE